MKQEPAVAQKNPAPANMNEIYSHEGENIEISFNHNGWIFTGYGKEDDARAVKYLSKDTTYRDSIFSFKTVKTGDVDLYFMLQDHRTGTQEQEVVRVHVLDDSEFVPDNYADFITSSTNAEELYTSGEYEAALAEYLAIYDPASPELNEKIALLYETLGQPEEAFSYWEANFSRDDEYKDQAAEHLLSYSVENKDMEGMNHYLSYFLDKGVHAPPEYIVEIARYLEKKNDYSEAKNLLDTYLGLYNSEELLDKLYYLLAGLYESNSGIRDLNKAKFYYEKIVSNYPYSSYFRSWPMK
jgi:TolA-binding protein